MQDMHTQSAGDRDHLCFRSLDFLLILKVVIQQSAEKGGSRCPDPQQASDTLLGIHIGERLCLAAVVTIWVFLFGKLEPKKP